MVLTSISGLSPAYGPTTGGSTVSISGSGFTGATAVYFGTALYGNMDVVNDNLIYVYNPPHAAGVVDVTVVAPGGTSPITAADQFTYTDPPPASTSTYLSLSANPTTFGQSLTLTATVSHSGYGAAPTGMVEFEDGSTVLATEYLSGAAATFQTSTLTVGAHSLQAVYLGDTANAGSSSAAQSLTVNAAVAPVVTAVSPNSGPTAGGYSLVQISGSGFTGASGVSFGGAGVGMFSVMNDGLIDVYGLPAHAAGTVDVTVTTANGTSLANAGDHYTYVAPLTLTNPGGQANAEGDVVSLQVAAAGPSGQTITFGAFGLPSGLQIDSGTGLISGTLGYADAETQGGAYSVTVTAYDAAGDSADQTFAWTVANANTVPTLENPGNQTNAESDGVTLQLAGADADGDPLTYSAAGLPPGLTLNTQTGLIAGVIAPTAGAGGPYTVTVTASDGTLSASQSFTWTVSNIFITPLADQSSLEGDAVAVPVNAWDLSGLPLTYSAAGLPAGLHIDPTAGVISGTVGATASSSSPYAVTVTATDGADSTSTTFNWNVTHLAVNNPGDQTNAEGDAVALQVEVSDNTAEALTYGATGLPAGLTIDAATGLISGTAQSLDANNGPYAVTVSATNGTASDSQSFQWTITYILVNNPGDQINARGDSVNLAIEAVDPAAAALTYGAAGLPLGLNINATTGVISGTVYGADSGAYAVTVSASDAGHTATQAFTWTVTNGAVAVVNPGAQNNAEGDSVTLQITATAPAGQSVDSFTALGLPTGLAIDPNTGLISGTIDSAAAETNGGVYQVTVMAADGAGDTGSQTFAWDVHHTDQAPVVSNPGDQLNHPGDAVNLPIDGYDPDAGDVLTWTASGLPAGLSIDSATGIVSGTLGTTNATGDFAVTVTASDGTLSSSQSFHWVVANNLLSLTAPADQTNTEGDAVSLALQATDPNNAATLTYTISGLPAGLSYNAATGVISGTVAVGDAQGGVGGQYVVTVFVDDGAGDNAGVQFNWTVAAAVPPPTLTNPGNQSNAEGDTVLLQVQASDPAGNLLTYSAEGLPAGLTIDPGSGLISGQISTLATQAATSYTTTVAVNDGAGDTLTQTFQWAISHLAQPPWLSNPLLQINQVGDAVGLQLEAGDADGGALTYTAAGLPTGLYINGATGLIYGNAAAAGSYDPTVTAAEGALTATQQFSWVVTTTATPKVSLWVNGTEDRKDDVAILGTAPIPVVVTLQGAGPGLHEVYLQLPDSDGDRAELSQTTLWLVDGGSATVKLTALQASVAEDDVQILAFVDPAGPTLLGMVAGQAKLTNEKITFAGGNRVRAADTPQGMADRISLHIRTEDDFTLSTRLTENQVIDFTVKGATEDNGTALLVDLTDTATDVVHALGDGVTGGTITLYGTRQTQPGHAGGLTLVAYVDGHDDNLYQSNGFSVAAIPYGWKDAKLTVKKHVVNGTAVSVYLLVADSWQSDSDDVRDLNQVFALEQVQIVKQTGSWVGTTLTVQTDYNANLPMSGQQGDQHSISVERFTANGGMQITNQVHLFWDKRTGSKDILMSNSGFVITKDISKSKDDPNKYIFSIQKQGAKVEVVVGDKTWEGTPGSTDPLDKIFVEGFWPQ